MCKPGNLFQGGVDNGARFELPTTNYQLPTTNYQLPITKQPPQIYDGCLRLGMRRLMGD